MTNQDDADPADLDRANAIIEKGKAASAERPRLMAFVDDAETEANLRQWLTSRPWPDSRMVRGSILNAIEYLLAGRSPNILIVDISDVDMPASRVYDLVKICEPAVTVIAVGKTNDVGLYRDLVRSGISEYIVKPITPTLLEELLSPNPTTRVVGPISRKRGKIIAVGGSRGGVGTTSLAINLALHFAGQLGRRVALVDLDLQGGDCAFTLNLKSNQSLREALTNPDRVDSQLLERAMEPYSDRLFVLSSEEPLREEIRFTARSVERVLDTLRMGFHYVIVDVPRAWITPCWFALDIADQRIVVADQTVRSVRNAARIRSALAGSEAAHRDLLVINRADERGRTDITLQEIEDVVGVRPKVVIPFQPDLFRAKTGGAGVSAARHDKLAEKVTALAAEISGQMPERRRWWRWAR